VRGKRSVIVGGVEGGRLALVGFLADGSIGGLLGGPFWR
jgi:hypothetical protein